MRSAVYTVIGMLAAVLILTALPGSMNAGEAEWLTDLEAAKRQAAGRNVPIFALFTGSDWCGACRQLEKNILSQPEFRKRARKEFILYKNDWLMDDNRPEADKSRDSAIRQKYGIKSFPTVFILDARGRITASTVGAPALTPKGYIAYLKKLIRMYEKLRDSDETVWLNEYTEKYQGASQQCTIAVVTALEWLTKIENKLTVRKVVIMIKTDSQDLLDCIQKHLKQSYPAYGFVASDVGDNCYELKKKE